jgi:hypothetical protein
MSTATVTSPATEAAPLEESAYVTWIGIHNQYHWSESIHEYYVLRGTLKVWGLVTSGYLCLVNSCHLFPKMQAAPEISTGTYQRTVLGSLVLSSIEVVRRLCIYFHGRQSGPRK